ncbi:hypothetical protein CU048_00505 [Beijerinckiaceae bacterium]|nr:hypothetical protein CU048_00505 [Beijerinckiaceae bacterium]
MFDIVASNDHELALPVEVEGIDNAEARLPHPAIARQTKPTPENNPKNQKNQKGGNEESNCHSGKAETFALQ